MGWVRVIVIHNSIHRCLWNEEDGAFCLQAARLVFVRYTLRFRSTWLRMFPFNYSPPPHSLFLLALEGKLHNMVEKKFLSWKGRGEHPFYDLSQRIYSIRGEKKWTNIIGSRCWHCVGYWGWEELTQSLQLQRGIDGSQGPCDGSPSHLWEDSRSFTEPNMKSLCDFNVQETSKIKPAWCLFF